MSTAAQASAPSDATDAVLKPSDPVPEGSRQVQGIDFNQYAKRSITVEELVGGYASMGFQATSVGEAVRIINDMVSFFFFLFFAGHSWCEHRVQREPQPKQRLSTAQSC